MSVDDGMVCAVPPAAELQKLFQNRLGVRNHSRLALVVAARVHSGIISRAGSCIEFQADSE